jgi:hypothetical protein
MGLDETGDGHVDRWDRDEIWQKEQDAEEAAKSGGADAGAPSAATDGGKADGGKAIKRNESR